MSATLRKNLEITVTQVASKLHSSKPVPALGPATDEGDDDKPSEPTGSKAEADAKDARRKADLRLSRTETAVIAICGVGAAAVLYKHFRRKQQAAQVNGLSMRLPRGKYISRSTVKMRSWEFRPSRGPKHECAELKNDFFQATSDGEYDAALRAHSVAMNKYNCSWAKRSIKMANALRYR